MTALTNATNYVVREFLSRTIDQAGEALLDGQHFEYKNGQWILFDRHHNQQDQARRLSTLLTRNYGPLSIVRPTNV